MINTRRLFVYGQINQRTDLKKTNSNFTKNRIKSQFNSYKNFRREQNLYQIIETIMQSWLQEIHWFSIKKNLKSAFLKLLCMRRLVRFWLWYILTHVMDFNLWFENPNGQSEVFNMVFILICNLILYFLEFFLIFFLDG